MALPKFQQHRQENTALVWGVPWGKVTRGFLEKVVSEPSLKEGAVGRRGGIFKYTRYAGFHNRACGQPVLWRRLKPVIKTQGLL